MENCKICNSTADKTGSHIIPHFLLKRIDSDIGKKGRDREMGFVISEKNPSSYFGRATSVDTLKKIYGNIDAERIENNSIPLIEDYIFCTKCESELAKLENDYSNSISQNNYPIENNYSSGISSESALLFWISIFFRLSISKNSGVRLVPEDEGLLRNILNDFFSNKTVNEAIKIVKYKLLRAQNLPENSSTILHINPESQNPYLLVLDEFIAILSIDNNIDNQNFYGFKIPSENAEENNFAKSGEKILAIKKEVLLKLNQHFFNKAAELYRGNLFSECNQIYQKFNLGDKMPDDMKDEIFKTLNRDEKIFLGDKFSIKHKLYVICNVIKKHLLR